MKGKAIVVLSVFQFAVLIGNGTAHEITELQRLGERIFFDKQLSSPPGQSCSTCHAPQVGWTGPRHTINAGGAVYPGTLVHRFGNRKPPAACYASLSPVFHYDEQEGLFIGGNFFDGRATGHLLGNPAADQAQGPFLNPVEQNNPDKETVVFKVCTSKNAWRFRLAGKRFYSDWSLDVCSPSETERAYHLVGVAIAVFEDSERVNPFRSEFDFYLFQCKKLGIDPLDVSPAHDPTGVLSDTQWHGFQLFVTPNDNSGTGGQGGNCSACHTLDTTQTPTAFSQAKNKIDPNHQLDVVEKPPQFTDYSFDNLGFPKNPDNPFYRMDQVNIDGKPINPQGEEWIDPGLGGFLETSDNPSWRAMAYANWGKHKVPTLRNVDLRPNEGLLKAYGHNGYFKSIKGVVHFYNTRDTLDACPQPVPEAVAMAMNCWPEPEVMDNVNASELGSLGLSDAEEDAIVAFMKALSDRSLDDDDDDEEENDDD